MTGANTQQVQPKRYSGRLVVLLVLFAIPLVAVPLLLSGKGTIHQVDLVTLQQRVKQGTVVGSFAVHPGEWQFTRSWPQPQSAIKVPGSLITPPEMPPDEWAALVYDEETPGIWRDTGRSMPFAFFTSIENNTALPPGLANILTVKLVAAALLDPLDPQDRLCLHALDEALLKGQPRTEAELRKQRRQRGYRPPLPGEARALELLGKMAELPDSPQGQEEARKLLCKGEVFD